VASDSYPIVAIGASAGGVEALEHLFGHLAADTGCAFVVVTHLATDRRSMLPEIIARHTQMPVEVTADGVVPQPNHVYVLPFDAMLGITNRTLNLRKTSSTTHGRKPIDVFFSALAKDVGNLAVGIVLSGGDADGTLGIKAIKERAGLTIAQTANGTGPEYPSMPQSAIGSGMVDLAVPVTQMGRHIAEFARSFSTLDKLEVSHDEQGKQALAAARTKVCTVLRNQLGHDFSGYKEKTFFRRVQRRMQVNDLQTVDGYIERLSQDPREVAALFRDLLINVTNFFRDADAFEALKTLVIPKLFADRGADDTVRVWVPGCATGEEVYSIAILLREQMETLSAVPRVQIFATDVDESALSVARFARYPDSLLDSVPEERRKKYFIKDDGGYLLTKDVRDLCIFSPHSVIRDPPFSRIDLVSCRNLLIYFGADIQKQVIPTFHYALRPGGYLFLGTSENIGQFSELFTPLDKKSRIFRARDDVSSVSRVPLVINSMRDAHLAAGQSSKPGRSPDGISLRHAVEGQVLDHHAPAHVVVNRDGQIVYYSARTGKYLEPTAGVPTRALLTIAKKGLRLDLLSLLREAIETEQRVVREGVSVETDSGRIQIVDLSAEPLSETIGEDRLFLLVFRDIGSSLSRDEVGRRAAMPDESAVHLERELRETRERLQSLIEEYETALEELKSSNEELVSVNEELQSTNEELEASKEELQSVNEELHTVNGELNGKVDALDRANADLSNLFESTKVATVFLDRDLAIRSFTPAVSQFFNMLPSDRGRPITDLSIRISMPNLVEDVKTVLASGRTFERTISQDSGAAYYLARIAPYRDGGQQIEGAVLSFIDVTSLTQAEAYQKILTAEMNRRVGNMLATVISVAEQTYRAAPDAQAFKDRFMERIRAIEQSHKLLSRQNWSAVGIGELVRLQLQPFGLERVRLGAQEIGLSPRQALSLGSVLHELAANAARHGALSGGGRVELDWRQEGDDLVVSWAEFGGPLVKDPDRTGFGIKQVAQETSSLKGKADIRFAPDGLKVMLRFPREEVHG